MSDTLKCKVVMLPQNQQASKLITGDYFTSDGKWFYPKQNGMGIWIKTSEENWKSYGNYYHVYLTSNREIQAKDWIECEGKVDKVTEVLTEDKFPYRTTSTLRFARSSSQKIEATTDKSLNLPLIPESFVQRYAQMQEQIDEVLVETERSGWIGGASTLQTAFGVQELQLKTRRDGTVIIHRLKDSWTREELKEACWEAYRDANTVWNRNDPGLRAEFEEWFDANY